MFNSPRSGPYRHFWDNIRRYNSATPSAQLDRRTHNVPSTVEVAAFVPDGSYDNDHLNIRILSIGGEIR